MKIFSVFSVSAILMALLFAGCGGDDDDDIVGPDGSEGAYQGLASMTAGSWAEYTDPDGSRYKMEYHGTDTYNGKECYVLEFESEVGAEMTITQIWIEKATGDGLLNVMKQGEFLMKLDASQVPDAVAVASEEDTADDTEKVGTETYTTPTGKSVEATVYRRGGDEAWVSDEVPFGTVKSISNGEVTSELYDFGLSGATRDISKAAAESAVEFGFPDLNIPN